MRIATILCAASLALTLGPPALAADTPAPTQPIRAFGLPMIEALGLEIYRQDTAAWVATDALQAKVHDLAAAHMIGWIVVRHGADERVRFLRDLGHGPEAGYDIDVDAQRHAAISEPVDRRLTADELAAFAARQTATRNLPSVCRPGYNSVVIKDPEGDGWLVWLLAPMPQADSIPFGGHYRFTISHDGKTMLRRDALSASCITMPAPKDFPQGKVAAVTVTHVVSPTPVETHVFLQLQAGLPVVVLADAKVWVIVDGKITDRGKISDLGKPSPSPAPGTSRPQ